MSCITSASLTVASSSCHGDEIKSFQKKLRVLSSLPALIEYEGAAGGRSADARGVSRFGVAIRRAGGSKLSRPSWSRILRPQ